MTAPSSPEGGRRTEAAGATAPAVSPGPDGVVFALECEVMAGAWSAAHVVFADDLTGGGARIGLRATESACIGGSSVRPATHRRDAFPAGRYAPGEAVKGRTRRSGLPPG